MYSDKAVLMVLLILMLSDAWNVLGGLGISSTVELTFGGFDISPTSVDDVLLSVDGFGAFDTFW